MLYQHVSLIQTGSFSKVYRASDVENHHSVALKVVVKPAGRDPAQAVRRLVANEHAVLSRLNSVSRSSFSTSSPALSHPNVCSMLGFFEDPSSYVFVFEYAALGDLYDCIKRIRNSPSNQQYRRIDLARLVRQVCSAIDFAHGEGIAHRDIKPENVLLDCNGNAKLADWGLSCIGDFSQDSCIGTEKYLAPETFAPHLASVSIPDPQTSYPIPAYVYGSRELQRQPNPSGGYNTFSADYWSLGITILYTLFGSCPFKCACLWKQKRRNPNVSTANTNFSRFILDPYEFIHQYYFQTLLHGPTVRNSTTFHGSSNLVGGNEPAYWLVLDRPEPPSPEAKIALLYKLAHCCLEHLLQIEHEQRSMKDFLNAFDNVMHPPVSSAPSPPTSASSMSYLSDHEVSPPTSAASSLVDELSDFYCTGLIMDPELCASCCGRDLTLKK